MKKNRLLIIYLILALIIIFVALVSWRMSKQTVQKSVTAVEFNEKWNKVMADQINRKSILLTIDQQPIELDRKSLYFTENMQLMVPTSIVTEAFNCAKNLYNDEKLVIEKGSNKAVLYLGSNELRFNDNDYLLNESVEEKNDEIYVPAQLFTDYLNYNFDWNSETKVGSFENQATDDSFLPEKYNYLEEDKKVIVKDQGNYGTCWAFATLTALESTLLPEEELDFSENNLIYNNLLSDEIHDGGDYIMSMAYLMSWKGPVLEKNDPYGSVPTEEEKDVIKHVQGAEILPSKDYQQIKEMVFKYGGVESSMYMSASGNSVSNLYYNMNEYAYCYKGDKKSNHDVVIIGWDDHFSRELFRDETIKEDGAFICLNSWGEDFGNHGVFYISYEDSCIGTINVCYKDVEDTDNYDKLYQTDLCGWTGTLGFEGSNTAYFANIYTAQNDESIQSVGFYATKTDLEYDVFICPKYNGKVSLNERTHVAASGTLKNQGYYTIKLDQDYEVSKEDKFAIIIKIRNKKGKDYKLIPVEMESEELDIHVDLSDGEGYFSSSGEKWQSAEKQKCNICLKAYTKRK